MVFMFYSCVKEVAFAGVTQLVETFASSISPLTSMAQYFSCWNEGVCYGNYNEISLDTFTMWLQIICGVKYSAEIKHTDLRFQ